MQVLGSSGVYYLCDFIHELSGSFMETDPSFTLISYLMTYFLNKHT